MCCTCLHLAHSLALVGDVPEFREGRSKLAALEDRLQRRVEGRLADALQVDAWLSHQARCRLTHIQYGAGVLHCTSGGGDLPVTPGWIIHPC